MNAQVRRLARLRKSLIETPAAAGQAAGAFIAIYDADIPGDLERAEEEARRSGARAVFYLPDNKRDRLRSSASCGPRQQPAPPP